MNILLKIFDLHLDLIKFTVEKVDLYAEAVPEIFKSFPENKLNRESILKLK